MAGQLLDLVQGDLIVICGLQVCKILTKIVNQLCGNGLIIDGHTARSPLIQSRIYIYYILFFDGIDI